MSGNISHAGYTLLISASNTTAGVPIPILETADDTDPLTIEDLTLGDMVLDTNGNPVYWSIAQTVNLSFSINPSTAGFETMMLILEANKTTADSKSNNDILTLYRALPNGSVARFKLGRIISAPPAESQMQSGRLATGTFQMKFASVDRGPALIELLN